MFPLFKTYSYHLLVDINTATALIDLLHYMPSFLRRHSRHLFILPCVLLPNGIDNLRCVAGVYLSLCIEFASQKFTSSCRKLIIPLFVYRGVLSRVCLCKKESKQIRKKITNEVFRLENGRIHLPVLTARSMLYDGMRTAGVNNGIRHRAY